MKKAIFIIAAIAGLASLAITVSCNKEEFSQIQHDPAEKRWGPLHFTPGFFWWDRTTYNNCIEHVVSDSLCYMSALDESAFDYCEAIVTDGRFERIEIDNFNAAPMDNSVKKAFEKFLDRGYICFKDDGPILNREILSLVELPFIPAGKYPISRNGNKVVIDLTTLQ